jgi:hypothetical protein
MILTDETLWRPGDIGFSHNVGIVASGIRFAEKRDGELDADINHTFALYKKDENGEWLVIQAELGGVTNKRKLSEVAPKGKLRIHSFPDALADRQKFLTFLEAQVNEDYSLLSIFSNAIDMYLPDAICLRRAFTWICSGLIGSGLLFAGYEPMIRLPDFYTTTPAKVESLLPFYP